MANDDIAVLKNVFTHKLKTGNKSTLESISFTRKRTF